MTPQFVCQFWRQRTPAYWRQLGGHQLTKQHLNKDFSWGLGSGFRGLVWYQLSLTPLRTEVFLFSSRAWKVTVQASFVSICQCFLLLSWTNHVYGWEGSPDSMAYSVFGLSIERADKVAKWCQLLRWFCDVDSSMLRGQKEIPTHFMEATELPVTVAAFIHFQSFWIWADNSVNALCPLPVLWCSQSFMNAFSDAWIP